MMESGMASTARRCVIVSEHSTNNGLQSCGRFLLTPTDGTASLQGEMRSRMLIFLGSFQIACVVKDYVKRCIQPRG